MKSKAKSLDFSKSELFNYFKKLADTCSNNINSANGDEDIEGQLEQNASEEFKHERDCILNCPFTLEEIKAMANKLKSGKSAGIAKILAELLKNLHHSTLSVIVNIFNKILDSSEFPEEWAME